MFKTDATVRFGQILSAIELLASMGNFNDYLILGSDGSLQYLIEGHDLLSFCSAFDI